MLFRKRYRFSVYSFFFICRLQANRCLRLAFILFYSWDYARTKKVGKKDKRGKEVRSQGFRIKDKEEEKEKKRRCKIFIEHI